MTFCWLNTLACPAQWGDFSRMPVTVIYWLLSGYISTSERQLLLMTLWDSCLKLRHYFTNSYSNNYLRPGGREHNFLSFEKPIEGSWEIAWHQVVKALAEATDVAGLLTIQWNISLIMNCWKLVFIWPPHFICILMCKRKWAFLILSLWTFRGILGKFPFLDSNAVEVQYCWSSILLESVLYFLE